jgi:DNA-binding NtrC family response regulator
MLSPLGDGAARAVLAAIEKRSYAVTMGSNRGSKSAGDAGVTSLRLPLCALRVKAGPDAGKQVSVGADPVRIGSSRSCQLVLNDPTVSPAHCEIELDEGGYLLRDLGSVSGTFVEGLRVREVYLDRGARVALGDTVIEFLPSKRQTEIQISDRERFGNVLGRSMKMRQIFHLLEKIAPTSSTVLLIGETGTGKEVFARAIHETSHRAGGPYITVDCSAISENLIESELFGHARGAFTGAVSARASAFEEAQGGTIFLDEVGELPLAQQAKLLRALEKKEVKRLGENAARRVDVRIVAATNRPLAQEVAEGRFRRDLYYRLSVVEVQIPPLRERPEDIPLLAEHFLRKLAKRAQIPYRRLTQDALSVLSAHTWPGNVRELRNVLEKGFALAEHEEIATAVLVGSVGTRAEPDAESVEPSAGDVTPTYATARERFEREYLAEVLRENQFNVSRAARAAGIRRQSLHRLLKRHGIRVGRA